MELPKQEMELFLLFSELWSKNFFYKMFLNFANEALDLTDLYFKVPGY